MGRTKGSKNKPKDDGEAAGIGHNGTPPAIELTDEQRKSLLMQGADEIALHKNEIASIVGTMREIYKRYKADGIPKRDIDLWVRLQGKDSEQARAEASRYLQIFTWAHPAAQAELFDRFQDAAE